MEAEKRTGFRAGISTIDYIFTISQAMEEKTANDQELRQSKE